MAKAPQNERETKKEPAYPYYDLEASIKFASSIREIGGSRGTVKKSLLAKAVGLAESTPSFFQRLSSAKTFGIIGGWGEYGLTDLGKQYFYPQSEHAKKQAVLGMLSAPASFKLLIGKFDGETLPSTEILGNIAHQELGVADSWRDRIAQSFIRSAHFVGIIDDGGFLRYDAEVHTKAQPETAAAANPTPQPTTASADRTLDPLDVPCDLIATDEAPAGYSIWSFSHKGKQIKIQTPEQLPKELWAKLNAYVQILKPEENEQTPN